MSDRLPNICVFAPSLMLSVTVEVVSEETPADDVHFHPGGQGFWIARMLRRLGQQPIMIAPLGGECGEVLQRLVATWGVAMTSVRIQENSPVYVHDRRGGERVTVAETPLPVLNRHEVDDLYGRVLCAATDAGAIIVTGRAPGDHLPVDFYHRLGADLTALDVLTIGDLHGAELDAFLEGGSLHTLKVSDTDCIDDGILPEDAGISERIQTVESLHRRGAERIVLSASDHPTVALFENDLFLARCPTLESVDHRGSGDSMTAALATAALRRLPSDRALQLSCAAGAANVTRHGLGNVDVDLVERLADRVTIELLRGGD